MKLLLKLGIASVAGLWLGHYGFAADQGDLDEAGAPNCGLVRPSSGEGKPPHEDIVRLLQDVADQPFFLENCRLAHFERLCLRNVQEENVDPNWFHKLAKLYIEDSEQSSNPDRCLEFGQNLLKAGVASGDQNCIKLMLKYELKCKYGHTVSLDSFLRDNGVSEENLLSYAKKWCLNVIYSKFDKNKVGMFETLAQCVPNILREMYGREVDPTKKKELLEIPQICLQKFGNRKKVLEGVPGFKELCGDFTSELKKLEFQEKPPKRRGNGKGKGKTPSKAALEARRAQVQASQQGLQASSAWVEQITARRKDEEERKNREAAKRAANAHFYRSAPSAASSAQATLPREF